MRPKFLHICVIAVALLSLFPFACAGIGSSGVETVSASAYINCPFGLSLSADPLYVQPYNIVVEYSVNTLTACSIPRVSGNFVIANTIFNTVFYTNTITLTGLSQTPTTGYFVVNSMLSQLGEDTATFTLSSTNVTNSTAVQFNIGNQANIVITNAIVSPNTIQQGSGINLITNVTNYGSIASSNMVINIAITGPGPFTYNTNQPVSPISPGQSESISLSIGGVTPNLGVYNALVNISYQSSFTLDSTTYTSNFISNNATTNYTVIPQVTPPTPHSGGHPPSNITTIPLVTNIGVLSFSEMPLFSSLTIGNGTVAEIGFHNSGDLPIWVNITVPKIQYVTISLSANTLFLYPNQTGLAQLFISSTKNVSALASIIPINFTVTQMGRRPTYGQIYTGLNIRSSNSLMPVPLRSTYFENYSNSLVTTLTIYNPTGNIIYDTLISTMVPYLVVAPGFTIVQSGGVHNITRRDNEYILNWRIPVLQPHSTTLLTYEITNVIAPQYFYQPIESVTTITPVNVTGLRIFDIVIPTFFVNSPENITVKSIYTGTNETNLTFSLIPPAGTTVYNQVQRVKVFPNTVLSIRFNISAPTTSGTEIFRLTVTGPNSNQSFTLPVVVLRNQTITTTITPNFAQQYQQLAIVVVAIAAAFIIITMIILLRRRINTPSYSRERAEKMMRIRQRVKREFEE